MNHLSDKLQRVKELKNNRGIQFLLDEGYKIFKNPMLMHDLDYKAIAYTENRVTDDPLWNEFITVGGHTEKTQQFLRDEAFIDIVASAKKVALLSSENMKYDRLFGKVVNHDHILIGAVDIVACYQPIEEDDYPAFEAFCKILSIEMSKDRFYQDYGEAYQEALIRKLIDGKIEDKQLYSAHVEMIYDGLASNLYLALVDVANIDPEYTRLSYFKDLFKKEKPGYKYAIYNQYILIIITTDDPVLDAHKDLSQFNRLFQKNNIYAGISSCFENLFELRKYYLEALSALRNGLQIADQRIFFYEQFK